MMEYLSHHGVKGMKWGVRRYQNPDGTLTDEGRHHYGYGRGRSDFIKKNTVNRTKQGAKLGLKIGSALGVAAGVVSAVAMPYASIPAKITIAGTVAITNAMSGAMRGAVYGSIFGAIETHKGRQYIERYDSGLSDYEKKNH